MAEFVEATERLVGIHPAVSVFGSARVKPGMPYYELAEETARRLSDAGFAVVTGGGPGLMEAASRGAFGGGGLAVGLNIDLAGEQPASRFQHISLRFKHFFTRKAMFAKVATAFIVLPGGYGTLDELFVLTDAERPAAVSPARETTVRRDQLEHLIRAAGLVCHRRPDHGREVRLLPGGRIEPGESSEEQAAARLLCGYEYA